MQAEAEAAHLTFVPLGESVGWRALVVRLRLRFSPFAVSYESGVSRSVRKWNREGGEIMNFSAVRSPLERNCRLFGLTSL
jgi:hypothetical protein